MEHAGLLPVGVVDVEGSFAQQEAVRIVVVRRHKYTDVKDPNNLYEKVSPKPMEIGRALVNYSSTEIARIKGIRSTEIWRVLGYADSEYVALRENISLYSAESRPVTPSLGLVAEPVTAAELRNRLECN